MGKKTSLILAGALVAGAAVALTSKKLKSFLDKMRFYVSNVRNAKLSKGYFQADVKIDFDNNSDTQLKIDSILATLYMVDKSGTRTAISSTKPQSTGFTLKPKATTPITLTIKLPLIDAGLNIVTSIFSLKALQLSVVPQVLGVDIPEQVTEVNVSSLFSLKGLGAFSPKIRKGVKSIIARRKLRMPSQKLRKALPKGRKPIRNTKVMRLKKAKRPNRIIIELGNVNSIM